MAKSAFSFLSSFLAAQILRLLSLTLRAKVIAPNKELLGLSAEGSCLLAFWHDQQIPVAMWHKTIFTVLDSRPIHALVSKHHDGRFAANILKHFGVVTVDGSSTSGGSEAMLRMRDLLKRRVTVSITPDGPRGPKHQAKRGIAKLALTSGAPIVCMAAAVEKAWYSGSWDRMFLPLPFSRMLVIFDRFEFDPERISPSGAKTKESRLAEQLSEHLDRLTNRATELLAMGGLEPPTSEL